jgi:hypothetical protein
MTPADALRDVIARLERGHEIGAQFSTPLRWVFGVGANATHRAFYRLDLASVIQLQREVLPKRDRQDLYLWAGPLPEMSPDESYGSYRRRCEEFEARDRLIRLCRWKLENLRAGT